MAGSFKRWVADQAFVAEDPNAPQVYFLAVCVALDHLRGQIVQRPAHCTTPEQEKAKGLASGVDKKLFEKWLTTMMQFQSNNSDAEI